MKATRTLGVLLAAALLAAGCGDGDEERGLDGIEPPTFPVEEESTSTTSAVGATSEPTTTVAVGPDTGSAPTATDDAAVTTVPPVPGGGLGEDEPVTESVSFDDPVGDATPGVGNDEPPPWTDLAGATMDRRGNAYRLTVRLGGEAPERSDGSATMNIASFYDVDGDGAIDYEIWVNLGPDGWGAAWYDNRDQGDAAFGPDSNVTVSPKGHTVELLFPDVMLGAPKRFRFSLASEYGELSTLGSSFARRDDAPDDDQAVAFPG